MKDPELSDKNGQYLMGQGIKVYIDPFTYEDPNEAVREFAKEIDVSFVKIEEVIGAVLVPYALPIYTASQRLAMWLVSAQCRSPLRELSAPGTRLPHAAENWDKLQTEKLSGLSNALHDCANAVCRRQSPRSDCRAVTPPPLHPTNPTDFRGLIADTTVINAIEQDYRLPPPPDCPTFLHQLMLDCWQKDRAARPRFAAIVSALDKLIRNPASLKIVAQDGAGPSHPLLDQRGPPPLSACNSVGEWLRAIKMERYEEGFLQAGFTSFQMLSQISTE
ncbi:hypothetical protein Z043_121915 [Scleropages formosus]|uniref:SAM domain-containing protein n=1 Tax=Scleropages formosus TaxID=113540 RepID=A0A0P7U0N9_SCLFO|nr:hypothetical protein Z043_121915 [Scleropages formosus]